MPNAPMPDDLRAVFGKLKEDVLWAHTYWKLFREIYYSGQENIDMINRGRSGFFHAVHDAFRDNLFMGLGRLTDPLKSARRDTLSIYRLAKLVSEDKNLNSPPDLAPLVQFIEKQAKPFREWRNRRLAHSDLTTALRTHPDPLPGIAQLQIDQILATLATLLNTVEKVYEESQTEYGMLYVRGDGEDILRDLRRSDAHKKCERAALEGKLGISLEE